MSRQYGIPGASELRYHHQIKWSRARKITGGFFNGAHVIKKQKFLVSLQTADALPQVSENMYQVIENGTKIYATLCQQVRNTEPFNPNSTRKRPLLKFDT